MLTLSDLVPKSTLEALDIVDKEYDSLMYRFISTNIKRDIEQFHILTCPVNCTLHEERLWDGPLHRQAVHEYLAFLNTTCSAPQNWDHIASTYVQVATLLANNPATFWLHTLIEKPELKKLSFLEELK